MSKTTWPVGGWLSLNMNLLGVAIVAAVVIVKASTGTLPWWAAVLGMISLASWAASGLLPADRDLAIRITLLLTALAPALPAAASNGVLVIPVIVGVMRCTARLSEPIWLGIATGLAAAALVAAGSLLIHENIAGDLFALEAAFLAAFLGGLNRRQVRQRNLQAAELARKEDMMRDEQARLAVFSARQDIARDLHDVLAHSLGGLVIQLDAADALLESGRADDAHDRLRSARELAASGLGDARRAVAVLREPPESTEPIDGEVLQDQLRELITTHRGLGWAAEFELSGTPRTVPEPLASALRRALQESLSNARIHAPGAPVTARLAWEPLKVSLHVRNPVRVGAENRNGTTDAVPADPPSASSGGHHGLRGMRERFSRLPGGEVQAEIRQTSDGPVFAVDAEAALTTVARANEAAPRPEAERSSDGIGDS